MNTGSAGKLYTPELLGLATQLAQFPLTEAYPVGGEARSRTCGSTGRVGLSLSDGGQVERIGMRISACVIGQASAALMAREIVGRKPQDVSLARDEISRWLEGDETVPGWPGFEPLVPARDFPARHGALLLPWNAIIDALYQD